MTGTNDDQLLTPEQVEALYKISRSTQAAMRSRRQIPFLLVGPRMPRYVRSELLAWLNARRVAPSGGAR
jgi:predicted DNA-binding transcriptional regulator AlpA